MNIMYPDLQTLAPGGRPVGPGPVVVPDAPEDVGVVLLWCSEEEEGGGPDAVPESNDGVGEWCEEEAVDPDSSGDLCGGFTDEDVGEEPFKPLVRC